MRKIITGILILLLSAVTSQAVYADAVGKFVKVEGRVDITRPGESAELVNVGTEIFEKDIIRSKSDSKAEILFRDGNVLRLAQRTRVEVSEYISDSSKRSTILNLFRGKIQNKVKKLLGSIFGDDENRYEVHTPTSVCGVRGTDFFMTYEKGVSGATFKEGFGYGYNRNQPGNVIEVQAGQSMVIPDSNAPPVLRTASPSEIDRLEGETTPAEGEGEDLDEEDSPGEMDGDGGEGESVNEEEEAATEEGDSESAGEETSEIKDEGSTAGDEAEASNSSNPGTEMADSETEQGSSGTDGASTTNESGFVSIDTGSSEGSAEDGGIGGFATDDTYTDTMLMDTLTDDNVQTDTGTATTESIDTTTDVNNDETQVEIIQEISSTDTTVTDPEPVTLMTASGKLMGIVSGTHIEGEYVLPRDTDPNREGYSGKIEAAMYFYDYFQADDGTIIRGSAEEEISDTDTWTMYNYLPDGTLLIEAGGEDDFTPEFTEAEWDPETTTIADIANPPSSDYYLRYSSEFATTIITGIGSFAGNITGFSSGLWSATASIPADITFKGEYPSTGDPVSLFKSSLSGVFEDGGAYSGFFRGDETNAIGSINALYINPSGNELGILRGDFGGEVDTEGGWIGTMFPTVMSTITGSLTSDNFLSSIDSGYLEIERLTGNFLGSSEVNIKAHGIGNTSYIVGQDWGIFDLMFAYASYDSTVPSEWSGSVIGFGEFGEDDGGMWYADITNGEWGTDGISGDLSGKFLTMTKTGTIEGSLLGVTDSSGNWAGISQGSWQKAGGLQFASSLDGNLFFIRAEEGGEYSNIYNDSKYSYHYDTYSHQGGYSFYDSANGTDTNMHINVWDFDGAVADFYSEEYVYDHETYAFIDYSSASATEFLLQSLRDDPATYTGLTWENHKQWTSYNMNNTGWIEGILGGLDSPWAATATSPVDITLLGFYEAPFYITSDQAVIFSNYLESDNVTDGTSTTFDGGAYVGYLGGLVSTSTSGNIYGIYIDPDYNAGILMGDFQGSADLSTGIWSADGGVYPVQLYSNLGLMPENLLTQIEASEDYVWGNIDQYGIYSFPGTGYFFDGSGYESGYLDIGGGLFYNQHIKNEPWGVWQAVIGGRYSGTISGDWTMNYHYERYDESGNPSGLLAKYGVTEGTWADGNIDADVLGAWVDLSEATVGVISGELAGTYDPGDSIDLTWQAVGTGLWIQAGQFLEMAATEEGRAVLASLNIPAIEIGKTTLSGNIENVVSVTMNDVTFFTASTGGAPAIWATGDVSGDYSGYPGYNSVELTDANNNIYTYFNIKTWDETNNTWSADISDGYGVLTRTDTAGGTVNVEFSGVASGTHTGGTTGNFTGEGAGLVRASE